MSAMQFRRPQEKVRAELFEALQAKFPKKSARGITRYQQEQPAYHLMRMDVADLT